MLLHKIYLPNIAAVVPFEIDPDKEQCAVIHLRSGDWNLLSVTRSYEVENVSPTPGEQFAVRDKDIKPLEDIESCICVLHTHGVEDPPWPSLDDVQSIGRIDYGMVWHPEEQILSLYDKDGTIAAGKLVSGAAGEVLDPVTPPFQEMIGNNFQSNITWYEFNDPTSPGDAWRVHVDFLLSDWACLYGNGCPGLYGRSDAAYYPDHGCCSHGARINTQEEVDRIQRNVKLLTTDDINPAGLEHINEKGWLTVWDRKKRDPDDDDEVTTETKTRRGACVFANHSDEGPLIGCAFVHLGNRIGSGDHIEYQPNVCSQLPIANKVEYDDFGRTINVVYAWDAMHWGGVDEDSSQQNWMTWWCVNTTQAYGNSGRFLYRTMERELRRLMGDEAYDVMAEHLDMLREKDVFPAMPPDRDPRPMQAFLGNRIPRAGKGRPKKTKGTYE